MRDVRFMVLGPVAALRAGRPVALGGVKQRTVLALLLLEANRVVSTERLVDGLWGDSPPASALTALHGHVSRLRKLLGPGLLRTEAPGYRLMAAPEAIDLDRFERLRRRAADEEPERAASTLRRALALWRGPAFADLAGVQGLAAAATRLDELRLTVLEELFEHELALGRHAALLPELEAASAAEPLRERLGAQLMLALYRSGRQADALAVYRRVRRALVESAGLEPGPPLRELERRILDQDPRLDLPLEDRARAPAQRPPESRGLVTVVAAGVTGRSASGGQPDAEPFSRAVVRWRSETSRTLARYGASVDLSRAGVIGGFGLPAPLEDHALRAARAAAEIAATSAVLAGEIGERLGISLETRIGVATGELYRGEGPAFAEALRLREAARPGETLLDGGTRRLLDRGAELEPVAPDAFRLVAVEPPSLGGRRPEQPLVGRAAECRRIREAFAEVAGSRACRLLAVVGPAGVGKSRLVGEAVEGLRDATVLVTRCPAYGDGAESLALLELVRAAAGLADGDPPAAARARLLSIVADDERAEGLVDRLSELLGLAEPAADADELVWAVRRLLENLARTRPLVLAVDDLQWGGPLLLGILERLARRSRGVPILVLATAREVPDRLPLEPGEILELDPLDADATRELIAGLLGSPDIEARSLRRLLDAAGGNPLFAEELVRTLRAEGALRRVGDRWEVSDLQARVLPPSIQALLAARLESLDPELRELLARAALVGDPFTRAALDAFGEPGSARLCEDPAAADLIRPAPGREGVYEFRHPLVAETAYATLPHARRAVLHERYASWLERQTQDPAPELEALVAHHLDAAHRSRERLAPGDPRLAALSERVAVRLGSAGARALARGDAGAASRLLSRARELRPDDGATLVALGRAHLEAGAFAEADEAFAAAEPFAPQHARVGRLDVRLRIEPGIDVDEAARALEEATAELAAAGDDRGLADAALTRTYLAAVRCSAAEVSAALEQALAYARRAGAARTETWILFLSAAVCWYGPLPVPDGIRRCREILERAGGSPGVEAAVLQSLGVLHAMADDVDQGRALVGRSRAIRAELGQDAAAAASAIDAGLVELLAGELAAAESVLREGYEQLERLGEQAWFGTVASMLADAVEAQDRPGEAARLVRAAQEAAAEGDVVTQVGWRTTQARLDARRRRHPAAERVAREAVALAENTDYSLLRAEAHAALADVLESAGRRDASSSARAGAVALLESKGVAARPLAARARLAGA